MRRPTLILAGLIAFLALAGMSGCPERPGDDSAVGTGSSREESGGY